FGATNLELGIWYFSTLYFARSTKYLVRRTNYGVSLPSPRPQSILAASPTRALRRYQHALLKHRAKRVVLWAAKAHVHVPPPAFGVLEDARHAAYFGVELGHRVQIRIETLGFCEASLLADVFGQHLFLQVDQVGRIDHEFWLDQVAERVAMRIGLSVIDGDAARPDRTRGGGRGGRDGAD